MMMAGWLGLETQGRSHNSRLLVRAHTDVQARQMYRQEEIYSGARVAPRAAGLRGALRSVAAGFQHVRRGGEVAGIDQHPQCGVKHPDARLHAVHIHCRGVLLPSTGRERGQHGGGGVSSRAGLGVLRGRQGQASAAGMQQHAAAVRTCNAGQPRPCSPGAGRRQRPSHNARARLCRPGRRRRRAFTSRCPDPPAARRRRGRPRGAARAGGAGRQCRRARGRRCIGLLGLAGGSALSVRAPARGAPGTDGMGGGGGDGGAVEARSSTLGVGQPAKLQAAHRSSTRKPNPSNASKGPCLHRTAHPGGGDLIGDRLLHHRHVRAVLVEQTARRVQQARRVGAAARHAHQPVLRQQRLRAAGGRVACRRVWVWSDWVSMRARELQRSVIQVQRGNQQPAV